MKNVLLEIIVGVVTLSAGAAEIYHGSWIDRNKNDRMDPYEDPNLPVGERARHKN